MRVARNALTGRDEERCRRSGWGGRRQTRETELLSAHGKHLVFPKNVAPSVKEERGSTERATKVACCSSTLSSTEVPKPSFRISTPNSLAEAAAPYSLAAAMVMSKGRTWSAYQGRATSLKPSTWESGMLSRSSVVPLTGTGTSRVREELKAPVASVVRSKFCWNFLGGAGSSLTMQW